MNRRKELDLRYIQGTSVALLPVWCAALFTSDYPAYIGFISIILGVYISVRIASSLKIVYMKTKAGSWVFFVSGIVSMLAYTTFSKNNHINIDSEYLFILFAFLPLISAQVYLYAANSNNP
ncbi:hypothetical protein QSV34_06490 [Porticoccus sp. W117]|uniref:hypothetical protein n=1 Tax=Porticoccus sp. W117 TaxID=3054777 RepID=UPI002591A4ED|nr:hypothetical protein [Porticoccus sp. W117]MDM3871001.1 hypothetical protein [Porticoccus sp. W117]